MAIKILTSDRIVFGKEEMEQYGVKDWMIPGVLRTYFDSMGAKPVYNDNKFLCGYEIPGKLTVEFLNEPEGFVVGLNSTEEGSKELEKIRKLVLSRKENPKWITEDLYAMWPED